MPRKKKPTVLMGGEELRIQHLTTKERHDAYTRLSHYLLSVYYLRNWLEQDKVLVKKYGFSDKSIFRPECRRLLEK